MSSAWTDDIGVILDDTGVVICDDCPCADCLLLHDGFDVDLSEWTQTAGSWSVGSSELTTSSANAVLTSNHPHPTAGVPTLQLQMDFKFGAAGDTVRLFAADGSCYIEATCGGNLVLVGGISGTRTTSIATTTSGTLYGLTLCIDGLGNSIFGVIRDGAFFSRALGDLYDSSLTGDDYGIATVAMTGTLEVFTFDANRTEGDCPECYSICPDCPPYWKVEISGTANGGGICTTCAADVDGIWYVFQAFYFNRCSGYADGFTCDWGFQNADPMCVEIPFNTCQLDISVCVKTDLLVVAVTMQCSSLDSQSTFRLLTFVESTDCLTLVDAVVPQGGEAGDILIGNCDFTGCTVKVTAIDT